MPTETVTTSDTPATSGTPTPHGTVSDDLQPPSQDHSRAMAGVEVAVQILEAARSEINRALGLLFASGGDTTRLDRLQARVSQLITRFNRLLFEIEASESIVQMPTEEEIAQARTVVDKVRNISVRDAILDAGIQTLSDAINSAQNLAGQVSTG